MLSQLVFQVKVELTGDKLVADGNTAGFVPLKTPPFPVKVILSPTFGSVADTEKVNISPETIQVSDMVLITGGSFKQFSTVNCISLKTDPTLTPLLHSSTNMAILNSPNLVGLTQHIVPVTGSIEIVPPKLSGY